MTNTIPAIIKGAPRYDGTRAMAIPSAKSRGEGVSDCASTLKERIIPTTVAPTQTKAIAMHVQPAVMRRRRRRLFRPGPGAFGVS